MKNILLTAIALCIAATSAGKSGIEWINTEHDFGAFAEGDDRVTAIYRFVNTGDEDVTVISATATCGCTRPIYDTAPIAPGDTATITAQFDPQGRPGSFVKQVYVRTTASPERYKLTLKGTVIGAPQTIKGRFPVSAGDLKLATGAVMVGRVYDNADKMAYIDAYNMSADTIAPAVVNAPKYITYETVPARVPPGELVTINISYSGDRCPEWGLVTDSITIVPYQGAEGVSIPVVALVEEDFSRLTPAQLASAPSVKVSDEKVILPPVPEYFTDAISAGTTIANTGKDALAIRRVYSEDPGVQVAAGKTTLKKNESTDLKITYNPSAQPTGAINCKITLITNDPVNPTVTIRLVAERK